MVKIIGTVENQVIKNKETALKAAKEIFEERFHGALVVFCAGSFLRGEETAHSDIDLVVLYPKLEQAWRESFTFKGWPVEAFVHDPETLKYFFYESDIPSGMPSLPTMVAEGEQIPGKCPEGSHFQVLAKELLSKGPEELTEEQNRNWRYSITDLVDDLRAPRSKVEAIATGVRLYESLSDYYFRSQNKWSASGKRIPRLLEAYDKNMAVKFEKSFERLFCYGETQPVIELSEEILNPFGGFLFDNYKRLAPKEMRKK